MRSSSEVQRITLSAYRKTIPHCSLGLANGKLASPAKCDKTTASVDNVNGIPEEDEEAADEDDEERDENDDTKQGA